MRGFVLPVDPAYKIRRAVLAELGNDAERYASGNKGRHLIGGVELSIPLDKEEWRSAIVESSLRSLEQIELPVSVHVEPQRRARAPEGIRDPGSFADVLEMVATIDKEALRLRADTTIGSHHLDQVKTAIVIDIGPGGAMLVARLVAR